MKKENEKEDEISCEWCGASPYYIAIYEDELSDEETFLCEECYRSCEFECPEVE